MKFSDKDALNMYDESSFKHDGSAFLCLQTD